MVSRSSDRPAASRESRHHHRGTAKRRGDRSRVGAQGSKGNRVRSSHIPWEEPTSTAEDQKERDASLLDHCPTYLDDLVAQLGGFFEFELFGGGAHLGLEVFNQAQGFVFGDTGEGD
jgi:hypothetical protein